MCGEVWSISCSSLRPCQEGGGPGTPEQIQLVTSLGSWRVETQLSHINPPTQSCLVHQSVLVTHALSSSCPKTQDTMLAMDGGLCARGGTTQGRRGQALGKKCRQLAEAAQVAEPAQSRARLKMLRKSGDQTHTERDKGLSWPRNRNRGLKVL